MLTRRGGSGRGADMPFLVAVALCTFFGCAVAGFDRDASRALIAVSHGAVALAAIALPRTRTAVFDVFKRFAIPTGIYVALLVQAAIMSGAFYFGASETPYRAEQAMVSLVGVGFFFAAVAGSATAVGRNRMLAALLWTPLVLAVLTLLDRFDGRGDFFGMTVLTSDNRVAASFASPNEAATAFALFAVFAAFACVDELTRRPAQGAGPLPALARRLSLPTASFIASFNLVVLSGSRAGIAAAVAGLAAFFFVAWLRGRKSRAGPRLIPIVAGVVGALALVVAVTSGATALRRYGAISEARQSLETMGATALKAWREKPIFGHGLGSYDLLPEGAGGAPLDALRWLAEAGIVGAALIAATLGFFVWQLWRADDHGRRPSRGFSLAAGLLATALVHGAATPALSSPAVAGVLAALLGMAAAYIDPLEAAMKVKATARTRVLG